MSRWREVRRTFFLAGAEGRGRERTCSSVVVRGAKCSVSGRIPFCINIYGYK